MPVNPGDRYKMATKTQVATQLLRTHAVTAAFFVGQLAGILTMALALIITGGR